MILVYFTGRTGRTVAVAFDHIVCIEEEPMGASGPPWSRILVSSGAEVLVTNTPDQCQERWLAARNELLHLKQMINMPGGRVTP